ncbi:MAG TPA: glycoside hydrolase family 13 protein [Chthoniobacterales bacterium]|jgi:alpha-glucosidase|nr:glycoside hydrolase family 13 protein [Chthoniobacterales bacterium]
MIYQIFPERFAIGKPNDIAKKLSEPAYQRPGFTRHATWDEEPTGDSDFFGGDLRGIIDQLDYIMDLGAEAVYLTPIFSAYSNHKYDTVNYNIVDPMFGDEAVLDRLIDGLHQRGMRLILDAVLNHVGTEHEWFQAARRGETPYRDFFTFLSDGTYLSWWGYGSLPELRLEHPLLAKLLYGNPDSVLQRWLARGLDSWRFDAAIDLGLSTVADIRRVLEDRFPKAELIGEVVSFGSQFCAGEKRFHGVMNYWFRYATLGWLQGTVSTRGYMRAVSDYVHLYGHEGALRSWNLLSTHDTARLRNALPDEALRKLALVLQFTLPGVPLVYYGEENGMVGGDDPQNRRPMRWAPSEWDQTTRGFYRQLVAIRHEQPELREGKLVLLEEYLDGEAVAYLRHTDVPNQEALIVVNKSRQPLKQKLMVPHTHFDPKLWFKNLFAPDEHIQFFQASFQLDIPPVSAAIYVADDGFILPDGSTGKNYSFFKPRILGADWP